MDRRADEPGDEALARPEIRRRALRGVVLLGLRGVGIRLLGSLGFLVLARLLTPAEFGKAAIGISLIIFGGFLVDAGMGVALVRRAEAPTRRELGAAAGLQLATSFAIVAVVLASLPLTGEIGVITAVFASALPLSTLRIQGSVLFERRLRYDAFLRIDIVEILVYNAWAIVAVSLGFGALGLATAAPLRALVGGALMIRLAPQPFVAPVLSLSSMRGILSFGATYQAGQGLGLARDQVFNVTAGVLGGLAGLGLWSVAARLTSLPGLLFEALGRVAMPTMARLIGVGDSPRSMIDKTIADTALVSGAVAVLLVGPSAATIPLLIGDEWRDASLILAGGGLSMAISGPISIGCASYLFATGDVRTPLRAVVAQIVAGTAVIVALYPLVGIGALGLGLLAVGLADSLVISRVVRRETGARVFGVLIVPASSACAAGGVAWAIATRLPASELLAAGASIAAGAAVYAGLVAVFAKPAVRTLWRAAREALRGSGPA